jgi:hypothetical protein
MSTLIAGAYFFSFTSQSIPICGRCIKHWAGAWTFGSERAKRLPASPPSVSTTEYADKLECTTYWRELNSCVGFVYSTFNILVPNLFMNIA